MDHLTGPFTCGSVSLHLPVNSTGDQPTLSPSMEPPQLSILSCIACKERKLRCSRDLPRCNRCDARGVQCAYPRRKKRRTARIRQANDSAAGISGLLVVAAPVPRAKQGVGDHRSGTPARLLSGISFGRGVTERSCIAAVGPPQILADAMDEVKLLKQQYHLRAVVTGRVEIPRHLAKQWIYNYFTSEPTDMFQSLINKKLINAMPNIIDSPRIRLEPVLYVLYYAILYIGCTFSANNGTAEPNFELAGSCYLACLRVLPVWQPQADGSALDFVAALFMVRIAMLCCDHDLAWLMHRNACAYAQRFNLHNLDSGDQTGLQHDASCDEGRRGFWQMIQIDLHVRLILDKPATITAGAWNVNLPWLSARSRPPPGDVKATAFLITSQMAMILLQFFTFFDNAVAGGQEDLRQRTKRLCQEIQHIFANWQVDEWFAAPSDRKVDNCYKSDVLLAGYTYIIFMLRKVEGLEHEPTEVSQAGSVSLIVRDASRRIVELLNHMLKLYPNPQGLLCVLGYYKPELAVGLLYSQVIDTPDTLESRADAERLRELGGSIRDIITRRQDLTPLARAIEALDGALPKESLSSE